MEIHDKALKDEDLTDLDMKSREAAPCTSEAAALAKVT